MFKKFLIFLLLIIFFLFLIPQISYENNINKFFWLLNLPLFVIIAFMGVWIIEALVINKRLTGTPQTAFLTSLIANLITILLGFFVFSFDKILLKLTIYDNYEVVVIFFFLASVIIEAFVLHLIYRQENRTKIFTTSFLMNLIAYSFFIIFYFSLYNFNCIN